MLLLKRLADARRDGDRVLAVIRGSAVNNDGQATRLTAPSPHVQQQLCRAAVERAGIDPGDVGLVEAHGPGTAVGDPIEYASVNAVYLVFATGMAVRRSAVFPPWLVTATPWTAIVVMSGTFFLLDKNGRLAPTTFYSLAAHLTLYLWVLAVGIAMLGVPAPAAVAPQLAEHRPT
ncbi:hypothetical protein [Streptomyces sp. AN091965]|uniref:hypothetical protein n=1 Tax=Streptomyces sp. AN091965 TaxID=2927803 RepID=UPI0035A818B3